MDLTVQNGVARAVFSFEPTASIVSRSGHIKIELSKKAKVVAARYQSKAEASTLINLLKTGYNFVLNDQDKNAILGVQF